MGRLTETTFLYCINDQCRTRLVRVDMLHPIDDYEELGALGVSVQQGWRVNDVFDLENVAFSRQRGPDPSVDPRDKPKDDQPGALHSSLRYLCCGECDWGPIGYAILENRSRPLIIIDQNKVSQ